MEYKVVKSAEEIEEKVSEIVDSYGEIYRDIAVKIIDGEYGNGSDRIDALVSEHRDPQFAQEIVNALM